MKDLNTDYEISNFFLNHPGFIEALLISFQYNRKSDEIIIVSDYVNFLKNKRELREFRKLVFKSVVSFNRDRETLRFTEVMCFFAMRCLPVVQKTNSITMVENFLGD